MNSNIRYISIIILSIVVMILTIFLLELILLNQPQLIPDRILYKMSAKRVLKRYGIDPLKVVEKLNCSPWVKFKPNATIVDAIRPHEVSSFVSKWTTDSLGFKNPPNTLLNGRISTITLGDSHVEGVGVSSSQTFAAIMSSKYNIPTYNLGVQGYGPQQMLSVYSLYGDKLKPNFVIFCYNGSLFKRAALLQKGKMEGRIASRLTLDEKREKSSIVNESVFLTALKIFYLEMCEYRYKKVDFFIPYNDQSSKQDFIKYLISYCSYYFSEDYFNAKDEVQSKIINESMEITKKCIKEFCEEAQKNNSIPIVFIMPSFRYEIELLYPETFQDKMKGTFIEVEYNGNKEILMFCKMNNIHVIDGTIPVIKYLRDYYLNSVTSIDYRKLPFFKIDGHPSQVAHELYAETIYNYLSLINE